MKLKYTLFTLCSALLISQCATISTGNGPSAPESDIYGAVQTKRDITFSLNFTDDYGPEAWFDEDKIIIAIRENFNKCGMFNKVHYVSVDAASDSHYHFRVNLSGTDRDTRMMLTNLSSATLCVIPVWLNTNLYWGMSYICKGEEVFVLASEQSASDVFWLPGVVTWPFLNHATTGSRMKNAAIYYFLKEIRANKLNER